MNGTPVRPRTDTVVSALPAASDPPAAKSTSCPADARVARARARAATAAISRPDTPGWRPKGWMPTPTTATPSSCSFAVLRGPEGKGHRAAVARSRDEHELHRHPDAQPRGIGLRQPRLDPDLARAARRSRRRRARSPRPFPAYGGDLGAKHWIVQVHSVPRRAEAALLDVARRARRARRLAREGHDAAVAAPRADQLAARRRCPRSGRPRRRRSQSAPASIRKPDSNAIAGERATM